MELFDLYMEALFRCGSPDGLVMPYASLSQLIAQCSDTTQPRSATLMASTYSDASSASWCGRAGGDGGTRGCGFGASSLMASEGPPLKRGDNVQSYLLLGSFRSAAQKHARVERVLGDSVEVVFPNGVRQEVPRSWVTPFQSSGVDEQRDPVPRSRAAHHQSSGVDEANCRGRRHAPWAPGLVGLENLGNTCYLNSLLQSLAGCTDLIDLFARNSYAGLEGLVPEFVAILAMLWNNERRGTVAPTRLRAVIARSAGQFASDEQHDVQELAAYLLDSIHEDLRKVNSSREDQSTISHLFRGHLRSEISCLRCQYSSMKFDPFMCLSLPIVHSSGAPIFTLGDCFNEFVTEERLEGSEQWFCKRCQSSVDARKQLALWKIPPVLLVHLKRFRFDAGLAGPSVRKLGHRVEFNLEYFDLQSVGALPQTSSEAVFDLFALVDHSGSCGFGHYTATVWHRALRRWHRIDDTEITEIAPSEVITEKAYLLFFRRRDSSIYTQPSGHAQVDRRSPKMDAEKARTNGFQKEWPHTRDF
eukprot:TRINITY_DN33726_c0_g1_i1.p1 TRINITY_DN33726_c0_g1~~TRINITY_DN33726_c0_g1_i1.p1  ORF type:complete len:580 (-),score=85.32 TRINITY_DN33726_c0_g1_i1:199-1788(-)